MLIINDIDIIQTDANKIEYHSTDMKRMQPSTSQIMPSLIQSFSRTMPKTVSAKCSSLADSHTKIDGTQPALTRIVNEMHATISQINACSSG